MPTQTMATGEVVELDAGPAGAVEADIVDVSLCFFAGTVVLMGRGHVMQSSLCVVGVCCSSVQREGCVVVDAVEALVEFLWQAGL